MIRGLAGIKNKSDQLYITSFYMNRLCSPASAFVYPTKEYVGMNQCVSIDAGSIGQTVPSAPVGTRGEAAGCWRGDSLAWSSRVFRCRLNSRAALEQLNSQFELCDARRTELSCCISRREKQLLASAALLLSMNKKSSDYLHLVLIQPVGFCIKKGLQRS